MIDLTYGYDTGHSLYAIHSTVFVAEEFKVPSVEVHISFRYLNLKSDEILSGKTTAITQLSGRHRAFYLKKETWEVRVESSSEKNG